MVQIVEKDGESYETHSSSIVSCESGESNEIELRHYLENKAKLGNFQFENDLAMASSI